MSAPADKPGGPVQRLLATAGRFARRTIGPPHSLHRALVTGVPVILVLILVTDLLNHAGLLHRLELYQLDMLFRSQLAAESDRVVLVVIDERDYRESFHATSPLNGQVLLDGLRQIARAGPAVIGVDLDTADTAFSQPPELSVPVVWARGAELQHDEHHSGHHAIAPPEVIVDPWLGGGRSDPPLEHAPPANGEDSPPSDTLANTNSADAPAELFRPQWAAVLVPLDSDGIIRRYWRVVRTEQERTADGRLRPLPPPHDRPTFPWAIVELYCSGLQQHVAKPAPICDQLAQLREQAAAGEPAILNYSVDRDRFQKVPFSLLLETAHAEALQSRLRDRIVIVGGQYKAARDEHITPVGMRHGAELIAEIVDMECNQRMLDHSRWYQVAAFDVAVGMILLLVAWKLHGRAGALWMFVGAALLIVVATMIGSWWIFGTLAFWFSVTVPLVGVLLHVVVEWIADYHRALSELAALRTENTQLKLAQRR